ncbi:hypothetical protein FN846DRAFT_199863 [Sphaerosporella brunnea]|uniref:Uncharacterized protein n=1 Tax=Sphaerosporella brunnea TaxID=1250544 RepID=A0A5J5EPR8_9PEZI|nr:hypothetical protein FN846DRAFT_199863 [Sphaerosporella brunnea]
MWIPQACAEERSASTVCPGTNPWPHHASHAITHPHPSIHPSMHALSPPPPLSITPPPPRPANGTPCEHTPLHKSPSTLRTRMQRAPNPRPRRRRQLASQLRIPGSSPPPARPSPNVNDITNPKDPKTSRNHRVSSSMYAYKERRAQSARATYYRGGWRSWIMRHDSRTRRARTSELPSSRSGIECLSM